MLNFIDLFAGESGLSEGFIRAGCVPLAHTGMDNYACDTLKTRATFQFVKILNLNKIGEQKQCQPIWDEFANNRDALLFESEKEHQIIETKVTDLLFDIANLKDETKVRAVKTRVNQNVFRHRDVFFEK